MSHGFISDNMQIQPKEIIIAVLQNPREKVIGVLHEINAAGVFVRGIDLNAFEDFTQAIIKSEQFFGMNDNFFPMWRIERIAKDESSMDLPSMQEQFTRRTGLKIEDF
jgi:hypothetical protein